MTLCSRYSIFILMYFGFAVFQAQVVSTISDEKPLKIGIAGSAPFVLDATTEKTPVGIVPEIWEEISDDLKWQYEYAPFTSVTLALDALKSGKVDAVVGPVTINSKRLDDFKFSQPFYQSSLGIAYESGHFSFWNVIKLLFSFKLLIAIAIFLVILTIVGTLLWLAERKASPEQFSNEPAKGIGTGMWLAIVTMSTTGYGDKAPITLLGRIIAGTWMIISIISATSMVAGIASVLTFSNFQSQDIKSIEQLSGKTVATLSGSPAVEFLREHKASVLQVNTLQEARALLSDKKVSAIVYDRPQLMYFIKNAGDSDLNISKAEYYKQGYGFVFRKESDLTYHVNRSLLELAESQKLAEITTEYLGNDQ